MPQFNGAIASINEMSPVLSAIGTGLGGITQARATNAEGQYYKQVADQNAQLATINAEDAVIRGDKNAKNLKQQAKRLIGAQRAAIGAQGIEVNADDALDLQMDTAGQAELDAREIKNNAWREAWGYKVQAANYTSQGKFAELSAKNKSRNTILTTGLQITNDLNYGQYLRKTKTTPKYAGYTED